MIGNDVEKQSLIQKNKKNNVRNTIGISVLVFVVVVLLATFATLIYFRAKGLKNDKNDKVVPVSIPTPDVKDVLKEEPVDVIPKPHDVVVNIPPSGPTPDDVPVPPEPRVIPPISPIEPLPMPLDPLRVVTDDPDQVEDLPEPPADPLPEDIPEEVPAPREEALPDAAVDERPKLKPEEMTVENITKAFGEFAEAKKIHVIDGDFFTCSEGGCVNPGGKVIHKWKLDAVAAEFEGKPDVDLEKEFDTIVQYYAHNRQFGFYYKDVEDYKLTFKIFRDNVKIVEEHNKDPDRLYDMELNNFAAYSSDNIVTNKRFIEPLYTVTKSASGFDAKKNQEIDVDWRKEGKVSQVVQQGACGSCWAVAATDVVNSFMSIKKKKSVKLSIQQVVDCTDPKYTCKTGGYHGKALNYLMNNKMCSNDEYRYTAHDAKCVATECQQDTGVKEVRRLNREDALEHLKRKGPFLTSFKTNTRFLLYADGIFNGECKFGQGHSVVVVGHGRDTQKKVDYWIVKNSWDTFWGEAGYFRMLDSFEMLNGEKYHHCNFLAESYGVF